MGITDEDREHIRRLVATFPPLSPAQRAQIAAIVTGARLQKRPDPGDLHDLPSEGQS